MYQVQNLYAIGTRYWYHVPGLKCIDQVNRYYICTRYKIYIKRYQVLILGTILGTIFGTIFALIQGTQYWGTLL